MYIRAVVSGSGAPRVGGEDGGELSGEQRVGATGNVALSEGTSDRLWSSAARGSAEPPGGRLHPRPKGVAAWTEVHPRGAPRREAVDVGLSGADHREKPAHDAQPPRVLAFGARRGALDGDRRHRGVVIAPFEMLDEVLQEAFFPLHAEARGAAQRDVGLQVLAPKPRRSSCTSGPRQGDRRQGFAVQLGVDGGGLQAGMAKQVPDGLHRHIPANHLGRNGVSENVGAGPRDGDAGATSGLTGGSLRSAGLLERQAGASGHRHGRVSVARELPGGGASSNTGWGPVDPGLSWRLIR